MREPYRVEVNEQDRLLEELEDAIHAVVDAPPPNLSDLGEVA